MIDIVLAEGTKNETRGLQDWHRVNEHKVRSTFDF